jgi:hypothetical protein
VERRDEFLAETRQRLDQVSVTGDSALVLPLPLPHTSAETARDFYAALRSGEGNLDTARAAQALHQTVRGLRDMLPDTPSLWAAYIHAGA